MGDSQYPGYGSDGKGGGGAAERVALAMPELTDEKAWWQPRLGKKLKDLSTAELNALAAGMQRCIGSNVEKRVAEDVEDIEILDKIKAELAQRGNPLETA